MNEGRAGSEGPDCIRPSVETSDKPQAFFCVLMQVSHLSVCMA